MRFKVNVWVKEDGLGVSPVSTVEEAIEMLAEWPSDRRGPLYYVASNSLESARTGSIPPDEAKNAFVDFCHDAGILAEERLLV